MCDTLTGSGPGSSVGIATDYGLHGPGIESWSGARFFARPDRPGGPPSLLYNRYWVFPGGKVRPGRAADHSPPSSAEVLEE
jgi:8-oxo-dGTP pyrophosphatase MutT (NUDIX family)